MLTFFCVVEGESASRAFDVEVGSNSTVSKLKAIIAKDPRSSIAETKKINLWIVSIPTDKRGRLINIFIQDGATRVVAQGDEGTNLASEELSEPRARISTIFSNEPDECTYIFVQQKYRVWYIIDLPAHTWCSVDLKDIRNVAELRDAITKDCEELKHQGKSLIYLKATNMSRNSSEAVVLDPWSSLREVLTLFEIMEVDDTNIEKVFSEHILVFVSYATDLSTTSRKSALESVSQEKVLEQLRDLQNDNKTIHNNHKTLYHKQEELKREFKKSKHTLTSNLDIADLVLREAEISYEFFKDRFQTVSTTFLDGMNLLSDDMDGLRLSCRKESNTQEKFNAFFSLLKASTQAPWVIHDSSVDNYLKDPIGKIDFCILDGAIVTWSQLVSAIELKFNIGDKKKPSGESCSDSHHEAIGQLADRFSTIFGQQEDRKEIIGAIASDSQVEFLYRDREFNYKRSGLLKLDFLDKDSVGLLLLTKLVTSPKELLGYVPPINEQHLVESSIPGFKFGAILRRRPSTPGAFVAAVTTNQNEEAVIKTSLSNSVNELQILQILASYNVEHTPRVYKSGVLYNGHSTIRDVALAMKLAYQHNIIHRDVKPSNIVTYGDYGYLIDWGIATNSMSRTSRELSATVLYCSIKILLSKYCGQPFTYTLSDDIESLFYTVVSILCEGRKVWDKGFTDSDVLMAKCFAVTFGFERQLQYAAEEHRAILEKLHDLLFEGSNRKEVAIDQVIDFLTANLAELE
ncbi:hypothetical protein BGZ49_002345 [Haplosporangium sp. Z 27]|nr:hypothetical protein BGZ49_002345 [Haplosporangium sp. Z 27]